MSVIEINTFDHLCILICQLKDFLNQDPELNKKSILLVFLSGIVNPVDVETAYLQLVQGFYKKEKIFEEFKDQLKAILE